MEQKFVDTKKKFVLTVNFKLKSMLVDSSVRPLQFISANHK